MRCLVLAQDVPIKGVDLLGEFAYVSISMVTYYDNGKYIYVTVDIAKLIKLLRLLQPNNHSIAQSILKKVSGKDFGERNYKAWEE
jgi:hypothetical protein